VGRDSSVARPVTAPPLDPLAQALFSPTCLDSGGEARRIEGSAPVEAVASARREEAEVSVRRVVDPSRGYCTVGSLHIYSVWQIRYSLGDALEDVVGAVGDLTPPPTFSG
jgi:hypothetical protein